MLMIELVLLAGASVHGRRLPLQITRERLLTRKLTLKLDASAANNNPRRSLIAP